MEETINRKLKIDFLLSNNTHSKQNTFKKTLKKCRECNRKRKNFNQTHQICHLCYRAKTIASSGNKVIDDFVRFTLTNRYKRAGKMEFVNYDRFEHVKFIDEGGYSKIYKATWMDGPISRWNEKLQNYRHDGEMIVALKELNNSKNINSKELNELKIFYNLVLLHRNHGDYDDFDDHNYISKYFGITQNPITQNFMIITKYYKSGNLSQYITKDFFNISWNDKFNKLFYIISGLKNIHYANITHKDYHSGNIFVDYLAIISDLGISKSAIAIDNNEVYGIIPYVAPEIFQGSKYTKASDIYSFGMIMWELITGRKPFWDQSHDMILIIKICDGFRPPINTNAPEGYVELMQECWNSDPNKRPTASEILKKVDIMKTNEFKISHSNPTKIIRSPDIGPVIINNPGAVYKSRPLSAMIKSAEYTRSLRNQSTGYYQNDDMLFNDKRKINENNNRQDNKKIKLFENECNDYLVKGLIDDNVYFNGPKYNEIILPENGFDI